MKRGTRRFSFGEFTLDLGRRELLERGEAVALQPKAFETLKYLVENADRVVSKDELLDCVWKDTVVTENVLPRVISMLRKALGDSARSSTFIRAAPRIGYRFVANVERDGETAIPAPGSQSLAVFPFRAPPAHRELEALELGMAQAVITRLSTLSNLIIRPLSTAGTVLSKAGSAEDAARALMVDAYLEGTILVSGDRIRVSAQLVDAAAVRVLWSESFDARSTDLFDLQDAICRRLVDQLAPQLAPAGASADATPTTDPEAYREYLEGRLYQGRHKSQDIQKGMAHLEAALDRDPAYAPAWAGLARCHELIGTEGMEPGRHFAAAKRAATRALALNANLADAECCLANVAWLYDWDWEGARRRFDDAITRHPNDADLHISCSDCCMLLGQYEAGVDHAERALLIDPVSPWVNSLMAQALHMAGCFDEAVAQVDRTLELTPDFPFALIYGGLARFCGGDYDSGIACLKQAAQTGRPDISASLACVYGIAGRRKEAENELARVRAAGDAVPPFVLAISYLATGRMEEALPCLQRAIADRDWHVLLLHSEPFLAPFRDRIEIRRLLKPLGLPIRGQGAAPVFATA